jgi:hypothetical protein
MISKIIIFIYIISLFISCRPGKTIEVNLPKHEPQLVVEGYLEPGLPKTVVIQESSGYFDAPILKVIPDALVTLTHNGQIDTLTYFPIQLGNFQLGVYTSPELVPQEYQNTWTLNVTAKLSNGRIATATATTRILPPIPVETTEHVFNYEKENRAYITGYYTDPGNEENFYRIIMINPSTSIYPLPPGQTYRDSIVDYILTDDLINGSRIPFGSPPWFEPGEEVKIKLISIDQPYYKYLESLTNAIAGNGSPFVEPFNVKGNIQGTGVAGIFTGLSYTLYRDTIPIP